MANVDDKVILREPIRVRFDECRGSHLEAFANNVGGMGGEVNLPRPAAGERDERVPRS